MSAFKAKQLFGLVEKERMEFDIDFMLLVLGYVTVYETGMKDVELIDGTKVEVGELNKLLLWILHKNCKIKIE